mmetsp:Transcript_6162/g.19747  ORF Transcript_6162/g.19747 Transcript_6162/m.19747 type:complete len:296 (+) Transcript_6162:772-1659(+)
MAAHAQKSERPWTGTMVAKLNAATLHKDVSDTPTPAVARTSPMTSEVWCSLMKGTPNSEKLRERTSISFTPRPRAKNGMPETTALFNLKPSKKKRPIAASDAKVTTPSPCCPRLHRLPKGAVQLAMLRETNMCISTPPVMIKPHSGFSSSVSRPLRKLVLRLADSRSGELLANSSTTPVQALLCNAKASSISDSTANPGWVSFILNAILLGPSMYTMNDIACARVSSLPLNSRLPDHISTPHVAVSVNHLQPFESSALICASLRLAKAGLLWYGAMPAAPEPSTYSRYLGCRNAE